MTNVECRASGNESVGVCVSAVGLDVNSLSLTGQVLSHAERSEVPLSSCCFHRSSHHPGASRLPGTTQLPVKNLGIQSICVFPTNGLQKWIYWHYSHQSFRS